MRIRNWTFGGNSLKQFRSGTIYLRDEPLWLNVLDWIVMDLWAPCVHCMFGWIKFPSFMKVTREGHRYTLQEWYGTVGSWIWLRTCTPFSSWYWSHPAAKNIQVELGYDKLQAILGEFDPKYFADQDAFDAKYGLSKEEV